MVVAEEGVAARPREAAQGELTLGGVCTPPHTPVRRRLASLGEVNSIGVAYFAGRSRGGNDAHLAAALTTELASQLLSARPRSPGTQGKDSRRLLVVKLSQGGGANLQAFAADVGKFIEKNVEHATLGEDVKRLAAAKDAITRSAMKFLMWFQGGNIPMVPPGLHTRTSSSATAW
jgi:hypothetical protein